ncbi:RagB/SusD family nutrient uptake outer membrane protein [Chitinophaga ginsengisoli]|uniref:SusD-like starch-binding protein associating with outer membrane n=1 Tax=Chitinophaga ginsengisoli TaxID=363837 RepID=A0A2P8GHY1_9BACT|nr:RagB/SusD family nutrient uptake outer membrane protein [Chitinophaga ginsengisoli]PSL33547.1 SusD-like starch-binding protein associating with outer membrane [Chitinophaga ginsengisoli]
MRYFKLLLFFLGGLVLMPSCKKFLDVGNPPDKIVADAVFRTNSSAAAVLTGIYYDLQGEQYGVAQGRGSISLHSGLAADELTALQDSYLYGEYTNNSRFDFWTPLYKLIYRANTALEGLSASSSLDLELKQHLIGEALFLRSFLYFYLVNLYGDVPLLLTSDYKINSSSSRVASEVVYKQILDDLEKAQALLPEVYVDATVLNITDERIRPNKWAALSLMARVYLYLGKWSEAISSSTKVIENKSLFDTVELENVFLKNSKESIWQLQPVDINGLLLNTTDARLFFLYGAPDSYERPVMVSQFLLDAFENADRRKNVWIGDTITMGKSYYYPFKYKLYKETDPSGEYLTVIRLSELFLIRSEAEARLGDLAKARQDVNIIRHRAGLQDLQPGSQIQVLSSILHERQVELFTEWGHRWLDLKRSQTIDEVMNEICPKKGGVWQSYKRLYEIPINELRFNKFLIQNPGYPIN